MDEFPTALQLNEAKDRFLSTGCAIIDKFLRGGLSRSGITQIYGEAGTGKTQLALQLCLTSQIPSSGGYKAGAIYICTESKFPSNRLQELLKFSPVAKQYKINGDVIFIEHISTVSDLESCVKYRIPSLLLTQKIGLIVIDSIAAPFRVEFDSKELKHRAKLLRSIGLTLHNYSKSHGICCVCINQVSSAMGNTSKTDGICSNNQPVLGSVWACQVTNSFCFCKIRNQRHIHIRESPYLARESLVFDIQQSGVVGLIEI
ncbi:DNA repair protein XRCC3-like [Chelonus insularis]|uniref:DNA repair protein XRCC3-like n=1 Tax=Chelonus insularis TaxID=460826 RepID=UPI00158BFA10|nr:DNA repair protein XRCC3-like [Chelonus insularis]